MATEYQLGFKITEANKFRHVTVVLEMHDMKLLLDVVAASSHVNKDWAQEVIGSSMESDEAVASALEVVAG